jgi:DNA adenine methylase
MKPFLKWVGGKTQIIDDIVALIPDTVNNYYEPFVGGGSVLLAVLASGACKGTVYASDVNPHLIQLYVDIQRDPDTFLKEVRTLADAYREYPDEEGGTRDPTRLEDVRTRESYYYWTRKQFNREGGSARFLFLNKTCFRGVYREGPNGFNVPFGHNKNPSIVSDEHIRDVSQLIRHVVFRQCSFADALGDVANGDFVYLDPPYAPVNVTSFVGYTASGFSDHEALFTLCKKLKGDWVMSNADVPLVTQSFCEYPRRVISCKRTINSKNPESRVNEVLISKRPLV